jgi:hypothetical protein
MDWTVDSKTFSGGNWLVATPLTGQSTADSTEVPFVTADVRSSGIAPGEYDGQIQIKSSGAANSPQTVTVLLKVLPAGAILPPVMRPSGLIFAGPAGSRPAKQPFGITNFGAAPVDYTSGAATEIGSVWYAVSPPKSSVPGAATATMDVQADFTGLPPGIQGGVLNFPFPGGHSSRTLSVLGVITPSQAGVQSPRVSGTPNAAGCTPSRLLPLFTSLSNSAPVARGEASRVDVRVLDDCGQAVDRSNGTVVVRFSSKDPTITLASTGRGNWSATWQPVDASAPTVALAVEAFAKQGLNTIGGQNKLQITRSGGCARASDRSGEGPERG